MKANNLQSLYKIYVDTDAGKKFVKYNKDNLTGRVGKTPTRLPNANQLRTLSNLNMIEVRTISASVWKNGGSYSFCGERSGQFYEVALTQAGIDFIQKSVSIDAVV